MQGNFVNAAAPAGMQTGTPNVPTYATVLGPHGAPIMPKSSVFAPSRQKRKSRINLPILLFNVFGPWLLFSALYAIMSFRFHYNFPELCWLVQLFGFGPAVATAFLGFTTWRRGNDPMWYAVSTLLFGLAVFAATTMGEMNFATNMKPYYSVVHWNTYPSVNVASDKGSQMMDAGFAYFKDGTGLDNKRAMGFKSNDLYCVAPIVYGEEKMASYDFWAIGKNCCSGVSSDFRCGDWNNPKASAGLRLLNDNERPFYRLAVQQAEAAYNVKSTHPVFFHWMLDPTAEANTWREAGYSQYSMGVFGYFIFSCVMVLLATICLAMGIAALAQEELLARCLGK